MCVGKNSNGTVYIFNNNTAADNTDSEDEVYAMKTIRTRQKVGKSERSQQQEKPQETINHDLLPEDTLTSLSLKYNCKVSELKRINHIWNGNELSARSSILIPVAAHSLLLEQGTTTTTTAAASSTLQKPQEVDIRKISIKDLGDTADTAVFLERMNADIETLLKATQAKTRHASLNDVKSALTVERIFPKRVSSSRGSGETLALILVSTLVIFVILPGALVYWDVVKFSA
eukprot:sb/3469422/